MNGSTSAATAEVYDLAGAQHRIVLDGDATDGMSAVVEVTLLPGAGTPMHSDEREDLVWHVVEGSLGFETPDGSRAVEAGSAVFVPRGTPHAIINSGSSDVVAVMVAMPAGVEAFVRDAATMLPPGVPAGPPPPEAMAAFTQMAARHGIRLHGAPA